MSLIIFDDRIEITIPNSEASVNAQHVGIKDRTVGSYYMSEAPGDVRRFLNDLEGSFYIDYARTVTNLEKVYDYIEDEDKQDLFKSGLMDQYMVISEIEERKLLNSYIKVDCLQINENAKYLKFVRTDERIRLFQSLLLGDLTVLVIQKLDDNCFMIFGRADDNYQYRIDSDFAK